MAPWRCAACASSSRPERVDAARVILVVLGGVDGRPGGAVDHDVVAGDRGIHCFGVGDVEFGAVSGCHVTTGERRDELGAEHAVRTGDEVTGHDGPRADQARAARALSGSHHARLSRNHCTTSARPCSNGTSGS